MIESDELTALLIATGVLVAMIMHRRELAKLPHIVMLAASFGALYLGMLTTVLEGFFWSGPMNLLEHLAYTGSSIFLTVWLWRLLREKESNPWLS